MNNRGLQIGLGATGLGAGLGGLFGGNSNPADAANPYLQQIPGAISPYYNPYMNAGNQALPQLQGQYNNLLNNPGGFLNQIGSQYQQSPGFQFALQQALKGSNQAMAAGGMAGSPEAMQQAEQVGTQLGNQDYYNWLQQATGMYGQGLQGEQGLAGMGFGAASGMADQVAQALAQQGAYAYQGQAAQNQASGSNFGNILGGAGMLLGAFMKP